MKRHCILLFLSAISLVGVQRPSCAEGQEGIAEVYSSESCSLTGSNSVINYGELTVAQLMNHGGGQNQLAFGPRNVNISITCPGTQSVIIKVTGLGDSSNRLKFGNYGFLEMQISEASVDGIPVQVKKRGDTLDHMSGWSEIQSVVSGDVLIFSNDAEGVKGRNFSIKFLLIPVVSGSKQSRVVTQENSAHVTFDLIK